MSLNLENARYVQNNAPSVSASSNPRAWHCPQAGWVSDASGNHARGSVLHAAVEALLTGEPVDSKAETLMNDADRAAMQFATGAVCRAIRDYGINPLTIRTEATYPIPGVSHMSASGRKTNTVRADVVGTGNDTVLVVDLKFGSDATTWAYDDKNEMTAVAVWSSLVSCDPDAVAPLGTLNSLIVMVVNGDTREISTARHPFDAMQDLCRRWASIANAMNSSHRCPTGAGSHCVGCGFRTDCTAYATMGRYYESTRATAAQETMHDHIEKTVAELLGNDELIETIRYAILSAEIEKSHDGVPTAGGAVRKASYGPFTPDPDVNELIEMVGYAAAGEIMQELEDQREIEREHEMEEATAEAIDRESETDGNEKMPAVGGPAGQMNNVSTN